MRHEPYWRIALALALAGCDPRSGLSNGATATATTPPPGQTADAAPTASVAAKPVAMNPSNPVSRLPGRPAQSLALQCKLRTNGSALEMTYTATNGAHDDAYLLDLSSIPRADKTDFDLEVRPIYLAWIGRSTAHLAQGIAPMPPDRDVYARAIPSATRLAPGASITRTVTLPSPLAEIGPYDAPAPASAGAPTIDRLVVTLSALRPSAPAFKREEIRGHAGAFRVSSKNTVGEVERARCEVPIPPTELRIYRWADGQIATFERAE